MCKSKALGAGLAEGLGNGWGIGGVGLYHSRRNDYSSLQLSN